MSPEQMLYVLNRAVEFVADQADVRDGPDGEQVPNEAMQLASDLMGVISALPLGEPSPADDTRNTLSRAFGKQKDRRFTGEPLTAFGDFE